MEDQDYVPHEGLQEVMDGEYNLTNFEIGFNVICIALILLSLVGNALVCYSLIRDSCARKEHFLFLNLAVVDLTDTMSHLLYWLVLFWMNHRWIAGDAICKAVTMFQVYIKVCSVFLVVANTADVNSPDRGETETKRRVLRTWLVSFLPALPHLYLSGSIQVSKDISFCIMYNFIERGYWKLLFYWCLYYTCIFVVPTVLGIKHFSRSIFIIDPWTYSRISPGRSKTMKLSLLIFLVFLVFSFPHVIERMLLISSYFRIYNSEVDTYLSLLNLSRGSVNPFLYLAFHKKRLCQSRSPQDSSSLPAVIWRADSMASIITHSALQAEEN